MAADKFPEDFLWGVATSSYQIEGGHDSDGKGISIWDDFCRQTGTIEDKSSGDVACDSYNKYERDVEMLKELGVGSYRFSISWPRIMPNGQSDNINKAGVDYYNSLINLLIQNNIKPCATLYHWDLPSKLEEEGGWMNSEMVRWFGEYADFCFKTFGDRVKIWITINEPQIVAYLGYCVGTHPPGEQDPFRKPYIVSKNLILAHATAYKKYNKYREIQQGIVSLSLNSDCGIPSPHGVIEANKEAVDKYMQFTLGWFADPIFLHGEFPEAMRKILEQKRVQECSETSRLPSFTDEERKLVKGSYDFFAINHYTSRYIRDGTNVSDEAGTGHANLVIHPDLDVVLEADSTWDRAGSNWLYIVPHGFRGLLKYISDRYGKNTPIYVTENGCSTKHEQDDCKIDLNDDQRVEYYKSYISEAYKAYKEDGVNLKGYYAWSLMDNFEWAAGYTERFGLFYVDFKDEKRERTAKKSAVCYKCIVANNGVN